MLNCSDRGILPDFFSMLCCPAREAIHRAVRVNEAVRRTKCTTDDIVRSELRKPAANFLRRDDPRILEAKRLLRLKIRLQIIQMLVARRAEQISLRAVAARISQ